MDFDAVLASLSSTKTICTIPFCSLAASTSTYSPGTTSLVQTPAKVPLGGIATLSLPAKLFSGPGSATIPSTDPSLPLVDQFVFISHMVTAPVHVQITLSHFAMSTADLGRRSFPQKMLRTTMDVACPAWLDFVHGGLQFQAVHHLYPRIPRHNLRKGQKLVVEFCEDVGIPYAIYGFVDGNKEVIGRLGEIGRQVKVWEECRKVAARDLIQGKDLF